MDSGSGRDVRRSEYKGISHVIECPRQQIGDRKTRENLCGNTELIAAGAAEGVPVGNGKSKVLLHRLLTYPFVRIVVPEGKGIIGVGTFVLDGANSLKELLFSFYDFHECL